jgi:nicotinic acid mononucleotide adenylyltransferase
LKPNQIWFDTSSAEMKVWVNEKLELATKNGSQVHRTGFYRDIPLFYLNPNSAHSMGWQSYLWYDLIGKFNVEADFWIGLEAARFGLVQERPEKIMAPLRIELEMASEITFYAGSFDPWHEGHASCVTLFPSDKKLIICPDRNPFKPHKEAKSSVQSFLDLKSKIIETTQTKAYIYPGFILQNEKNPTIQWVFRMMNRRPDLRISLLIGYDNFKTISTWTKGDDLIKILSGLYVTSRLEDESDHAIDSSQLKSINPKINITFLGRHNFENISSSDLSYQN